MQLYGKRVTASSERFNFFPLVSLMNVTIGLEMNKLFVPLLQLAVWQTVQIYPLNNTLLL
jgi:hypothetical protein